MNSKHTKRLAFSIGAGLFVLALILISLLSSIPVTAQVLYFTPTAEANGAVYYIVKENETCDSIALVNNVPVETLRTLNKLDFDACRFLQVGQKLLLAIVPTQVITAGPSPTPTPNLPTPEPVKGTGTICVYLYDDVNGNAMAEESETLDTGILGGKISITHMGGDYANVGTTLNTGAPTCFENIPEGEYTISIAIPEGFNPTSAQNYTVYLKGGDTSTINFSAQLSGRYANQPGGKDGNKSVFLAVLGGIILLAGVGVGLYARYIIRAK